MNTCKWIPFTLYHFSLFLAIYSLFSGCLKGCDTMPVYKYNKATKDGRQWIYKVSVKDVYGNNKQIASKRYATKTEAKQAEAQFWLEYHKPSTPIEDLTFRELYERFLVHQSDKVRDTTKYNYKNKLVHVESMLDIKCKDYTIEMFEQWKDEINSKNISTTFKNDILKFWKSLINYGMTWHDLNLSKVYRKITKFNNPNELKKEMSIFTYEEFQKYITVENKDRYRCLWKTLYYCGLRIGEARAITWKDIDFSKKRININKQIQDDKLRKGNYMTVPTKTLNSTRSVPICDDLLEELQRYHSVVQKYKNYTDSFYVFGANAGIEPFAPSGVRSRHKNNCIKAELHHIRIHDFRHSCASLLINNGASVTMVAKFLGHTKVDVTLNTYSHMFQSALDEVINIINNLNDKGE